MIAYGPELAEVYEAIYCGRGKDYSSEAADILQIIHSRKSDAATLLDVACGTGAHLEVFMKLFKDVEGLEVSPSMRALATDRLPGVTVHSGDMRSFRLARKFDAITCMFSSVGYLTSVQELDQTLQTFREHVNPGSVIVIEPWWFPEDFIDGYVGAAVVCADGRTIARVSHTVRQGNASCMNVLYTVAEPAAGLRYFADTHVMALFTQDQYETSFEKADCAVEYLSDGPSGRGLFVGVAK